MHGQCNAMQCIGNAMQFMGNAMQCKCNKMQFTMCWWAFAQCRCHAECCFPCCLLDRRVFASSRHLFLLAPVLHHHPPILPYTCNQHTNVKLLAVKVSLTVYFCTFKNEPCLCKVPTKLTLPVFRQVRQSVPAINTLTFLVVCQLLQSFPAPATNAQMKSNYKLKHYLMYISALTQWTCFSPQGTLQAYLLSLLPAPPVLLCTCEQHTNAM